MGSGRTFAEQVTRLLEQRARELEVRRQVLDSAEMSREEAERRLREDREPLPPRKWIENEYFSGPLARGMYDVLKERFCEVFERNAFEVLMAGAIGFGKTTLSIGIHLYSLYLLSCYGVPQRAFRDMVESAQILMLNLNTTKDKAKNSYYMDLYRLVHSTPYFQRDFSPMKGVVNELRFPQKNVMCSFAGATKTAAESEHLVFCVLDEANLYDVVERSRRSERADAKYDEAEVVYASALRRMQTRYMLPDGTMPPPCKLISLCKETYPNSFMRRKIREARQKGWTEPDQNGRVRTIVIEYAEWETKPPETYEKSYFWIRTGTRTESPRIIEDEKEAEQERREQERRRAQGVPEDELCEVIQVPRAGGEYLVSARSNLSDFIRDICGRATEASQMFFPRREPLFKALRKEGGGPWKGEVCHHPYTAEETTLLDGAFLIKERLAERRDGVWRPLVNPTAVRHVHVDIGLTGDAAGIAMGHISGWRDVVRSSPGGSPTMVRLPVLWYDFLLRVIPPLGGEIPYSGIRGIIYSLRGLGFKVGLVTYDSFQRTWAQELSTEGFRCELLSVDTSIDPYIELKAAYLEDRLSVYPYPQVEGELAALERVYTGQVRDGRPVEKIDHPPGGEKDVADAMAGVAYTLVRMASTRIPVSPFSVEVAENESVGEKESKKRRLFEEGRWDELYDLMKREEEG